MSPVGSQILPAGDGDTEWKAMSMLFQQHLSFLLAPTLGNIAQVKQFLCKAPHFSGLISHLLVHNLARAELGLALSSGRQSMRLSTPTPQLLTDQSLTSDMRSPHSHGVLEHGTGNTNCVPRQSTDCMAD